MPLANADVTSEYRSTWRPRDQSMPREYGLDAIMHPTFFAMERRRVQRMTAGRLVKTGIASTVVEAFVILSIFAYILASLPADALKYPETDWDWVWVVCIPVLLTVILLFWTTYTSIKTREHIHLEWGKTWCWLYVIWTVYAAQMDQSRDQTGQLVFDLFNLGDGQEDVLIVFGVMQGLTILSWFFNAIVHPRIALLCSCPCSVKFFWGIRASETQPVPDTWSYTPWGRCCCAARRRRFRYTGETLVDSDVPDGLGMWICDDYHGEVLKGYWGAGLPEAPFMSRTFGSGAMSTGMVVGYGTARAESISEFYWLPKRQSQPGLRYGVTHVECSVAGGFLGHLPQVLRHREGLSCGDLLSELKQAAQRMVALGDVQTPDVRNRDLGLLSYQPDELNVRTELPTPMRSLGGGRALGQRVLVLVHGYNCPIDQAAMRLGQLSALGKIDPAIMPIVFSWSTGASVMYFPVLWSLPTIAPDLPVFLRDLQRNGVREVHLIAHSLGCDLVTEALDGLLTLREAPAPGLSEPPPLVFPTVTFINATNFRDKFMEDDMPRLMSLCERVTLYCDKDDNAIWIAEMVGRHVLRQGDRAMSIGRGAPDVFMDSQRRIDGRERVDIIDCTAMDSNVHGLRHSYFDLNTCVVGDIEQLITTQQPASCRTRLVRTAMDRRINVFAFLAPPTFVKNS